MFQRNATQVITNCTYYADTSAQDRRNCVEDVDRWTDPLHHPLITISKLIKCLGFALNYVQDSLGGLASLHFLGERVVYEVISGLCLVLAQGGIEDRFELGR